MTADNQAIVADSTSTPKLSLREVPMPVPERGEALVQVAAISLNRGETRQAFAATAPWVPGWDFAGVVERAAADGSGPKAGSRVVGIRREGAWARYVVAPTQAIAVLPESVSFAQAATLPVAGLTALHALAKGGPLVERKVLVTGATGGVGDFAVQLARLSGARVVAVARRPESVAPLKALGAHEVALGEDLAAARALGPYNLILESVGGRSLGAALTMLQRLGTCVSFGASEADDVTFPVRPFFRTGGARLYGLILFDELDREPGRVGLARLAALVASGQLKPTISRQAPWREVASVAQALIDRAYPGKAVLTLD